MKVKNILKMEFQLHVLNPFIITFHHRDLFPAGNEKMEVAEIPTNKRKGEDFDHNAEWRMYYGNKVPGFPVHPHRGFETITVVVEGFADHFDSHGSKGRYGQGDVQWMTAGAGLQHSEMFPLLNTSEKNPMELFQIWLNLPKANKFAKPDYKMLWNEQIPVVADTDSIGNKLKVKVIAGEYKGIRSLDPLPDSWAADRNNHVGIWLVELAPNAELTIPAISSSLNRMIYHYEGKDELWLEDKKLALEYCAELNGNEDIHIKAGASPCKLLLLEGEPIRESVAAHGPFVMNTKEELMTAFDDYQKTQFGGWQWENNGPINEKDSGRFASYNNGARVEKPE